MQGGRDDYARICEKEKVVYKGVNMVVGCAFRKNERGEYVVNNEETKKRLKEAFPEMSDSEKEKFDMVEKELKELLGDS